MNCRCGSPAGRSGLCLRCYRQAYWKTHGARYAADKRALAKAHYLKHRPEILAELARKRVERREARAAAGLPEFAYQTKTLYVQAIVRVETPGWGFKCASAQNRSLARRKLARILEP